MAQITLCGIDKAGIQTRSLTSKTMLIFCMVLCNVVKNPPASAGDLGGMGCISGSKRSPGGGNGNHSSILTCKTPTREPGGLQSMGSQTVRHSGAQFLKKFTLEPSEILLSLVYIYLGGRPNFNSPQDHMRRRVLQGKGRPFPKVQRGGNGLRTL